MKRKDLLAEISRENTMRRSVFPRWIQIKKISNVRMNAEDYHL